ncbi:GNAT family N-acetyltransferase [Altererythrobacter sp. JGD-16]|uniref:GNAT family N-acetyltransferase n=1 Tax=Altererythrobacter lutimaris TaxID=2743979 RepID=A0A850HEY3_9SPHN|nr:GNAT family N-acetyltransferase [Altererythrobacter lutimaris]
MDQPVFLHLPDLVSNPAPAEELREDIWRILVEVDQQFVPPLSSRESTSDSTLIGTSSKLRPQSYFATLIKQPILCALIGKRVVGFLSYKTEFTYPNTSLYFDAYVSTIAVTQSARRRGIAKQLYQRLFERLKEDREIVIAVRTWSTNLDHIELLTSLGFRAIRTFSNDRGTGVDTVLLSISIGRSSKDPARSA